MEEPIKGVMKEVNVATTNAARLVARSLAEACFMDSVNSAIP